jgi:histidyl-tRNA synthetase
LIKELRAAGINSEIYLEKDKINKQFKLAQDKNIPWVAVIGEEEFNKGLISLKNMATGQQDQLEIKQVIDKIQA